MTFLLFSMRETGGNCRKIHDFKVYAYYESHLSEHTQLMIRESDHSRSYAEIRGIVCDFYI